MIEGKESNGTRRLSADVEAQMDEPSWTSWMLVISLIIIFVALLPMILHGVGILP